jgi:tRNA pseudouridine38-40 synthase
VVKRLTPAPADFHPRFSAKWRSYRYLISPHLTPFNRLYLYHYPHPLEVEKLNRFAKLIEGEHDFRLFAKTGSNPSHYRRTIYLARFYRWKGLVVFKIVGNGFLRGQVRLLVQFLLQMGEGKLGERELLEQLEGKRLHLKLPAPPTGLYLTGVGF